ncbi:alpha/beta hydrolase [Tahibacter amnicola]|uniref:Alpha/beta hydrolase n=1 Tax=Tahibacter amnicola TaxID=2976241 RepID=A0ABY6BFH9_9GAMM|nr:alpha/beta hydrolase [Tahibacter amnicola]UXI68356.1 alpha/beta hydrolase [Tahibacter amnicola]
MLQPARDVGASPATTPSPLPAVSRDPVRLAAELARREALFRRLKPDNAARIVFADPDHPRQTELAVVYLHGFSASQGEGEPQHRRLAVAFGANLVLNRFPGHGFDHGDAMQGLSAPALLARAAEALAMGLTLGRRVVLVGTSMGASLCTALAGTWPEHVAAVLAWSPGVKAFNEPLMRQLCLPGGVVEHDAATRIAHQNQYWSLRIHRDGYRSLAALFDEVMQPALFRRVIAPYYMACYYRDEANQDPSARVSAMLAMFDALVTPAAHKRMDCFPNGAHVIASPWRSDCAEEVFQASLAFLRDVVGLVPAGNPSGATS